MPAMHANRLLPVVGGAVLLLALVVMVRSCGGGKRPHGLLDSVPQAARPDADTPAETLRALSAQVTEMGAGLKALREDNAAVLQQKQALEAGLSRRVQEALAAAERRRPKAPANKDGGGMLDALMGRLDALSNRVAALGHQRPLSAAAKPGTELPVGLGLSGGAPVETDANGYRWTTALDAPAQGKPGAGRRLKTSAPGPAAVASAPAGTAQKPPPKPYYTVPANATLVGSTAMTALVGRIPVKGRVRDPWPFKVITGKENLAANGLTVPHVDGMVWSGTAVGDWTLGCVAGRLTSVTFVFDDGTIQTVESKPGGQRVGAALAPQDARHLGWISDPYGNPCVNGKRITNAPAWLAQRTALAALEAAGEAAAAGETTRTVSPLFGSSTATVTGDLGTFIAGRSVSGGAEEVKKWIDERMGQSFDAVFRPAGAEVAIHIDQEIPIDYHLDGRRLSHVEGWEGAGRAARLD